MDINEFTRDNAATITHLKKIPALECFTEKELEEFLRFSELRTYAEKECIVDENSDDDRVFYLVSGKAKVMKNGKELIILRRTGDVFGGIGVITGISRAASVYAAAPTTCVVIRLSQIDALDENNRLRFKYMIFRGFAEILANRLKKTSDELDAARNEIARYQATEKKPSSR